MMGDKINMRTELEQTYGTNNVFDTDQLRSAFEVTAFSAPFVIVTRKSDNIKGSLQFNHNPRLYFNFVKA